MTREEFKKIVETPANMYTFDIDVGDPCGIVAWGGDNHYYIRINDDNVEEYTSVDEMLEKFEVDGKKFADEYLPKIDKLRLVLT